MAESDDTQARLARMERHLREVYNQNRYLVASSPNNESYLCTVFKERANSANVFIALHRGPLTQNELQKALELTQGTISKILNHLIDAGLINPNQRTPNEKEYSHSEVAKHSGAMRVANKAAKQIAHDNETTC